MKRLICYTQLIILAIAAFCLMPAEPVAAAVTWTSPNHYRILFTINHMGKIRRNSPASFDINFVQYLANKGVTETFDENTIEVFAYNASGQPVLFDNASWRVGYEKYLLPWRIQKYYGINKVTLSFVLPSNNYTQYAVYFDTKESGLGKPNRPRGMVGDGDLFTDGYQKREVNACGYDTFFDFDKDGDLDLFKGGTEPYIYVYENVNGHSPNGNLYVDRGKLTSAGQVMKFETDGANRSWLSVRFNDWDKDGDPDLFVQIYAPIRWRDQYEWPYRQPADWRAPPHNFTSGQVLIFENITQPGGQITFAEKGPMRTKNGNDMGGAPVQFIDWDNDGKMDVLGGSQGTVALYRNFTIDNEIDNLNLENGEFVYANGEPILIEAPRMDCGDLDNDGDFDMLLGVTEGRVYWFENVAGPGSEPIFLMGRILAYYEFMDLVTNVEIHDFDGDGKLDFVAGRYWERTQWGEQERFYGCLYKNVTVPGGPLKFEMKPAGEGSPYTEQFQKCDAVRQNGVRGVDWNNDGRTDLIASDTDGFVWFFENTTDQLFPVFKPGVKIQADGIALRVYGEDDANRAAGYARVDITDWNADGRKDLLVADGRGWLFQFINIGSDASPSFGPGTRVYADGVPIDGTSRASVLVCDWNLDGKKDVIFAMAADWQFTENLKWDAQYQGDPNHAIALETGGYLSNDSGFLFYENIAASPTATPVLKYPQWIKTYGTNGSNGKAITYGSRPNLGSFVDWDFDGKLDLITGEFESSARFYRNTGGTSPGSLPRFSTTWNGQEPVTDQDEGQTIVRPDTVQMMSGADAIDWNRDWTGDPSLNQDLDILTGQGHGGSGLRFYERDYINDFTDSAAKFPIVSFILAVSDAKSILEDGTHLIVPAAIVSAVFNGYFYVETENRESGIRVDWSGAMPTIGQKVDVTGTITKNSSDERLITASSAPTVIGSGIITPVAMNNRSIGGGGFYFNSQTNTGQRGISGANGLNNIGILIKTGGRCTLNLAPAGDYSNNKYIFIDDGSGTISYYRDKDGTYKSVTGVKVEVNDTSITTNHFVVATGISSIELINGIYQKRILPRVSLGDVTKMAISQ